MGAQPKKGPLLLVPVVLALALLVGGVAWAQLGISLSVEGGPSLMGAPLGYRMAAPDEVTRASVDGITAASQVTSGAGVHVHLSAGESAAALVLGLEYMHYRFDIDYEFARARMDVVGMRALAMARLPVFFFRGEPIFFVAFGGYFELVLYDEARLGGSWVNIDVAAPGGGLVLGFHVEPYQFTLPNGRGRLVPGLFLRAYRGLAPQLTDEVGSNAPLSSITAGVTLRWQLPQRHTP